MELLASGYGADQVALYGSGTQALTEAISLSAAGTSGAPVALPAFGCFDLASAALGADARVSLYDIDPLTLGPNWDSLENVLRAGARTVVIAYLFGFPVDWNRVSSLAQTYKVDVIEDAAQGAGGSWHGRKLGALGPTSILSFGRGKGWTGGGGGALMLRGTQHRPSIAVAQGAAVEARTIVTSAVQWLLARPSLYALPAALPFLALGQTTFKAPMDTSSIPRAGAALALATRHIAERENAERRVRATAYDAQLTDAWCVRLISRNSASEPGYLRYPVILPDSDRADRVAGQGRKLGISKSYPHPLSRLPELGPLLDGQADAPFPGAETLADRLVTLPVHAGVTDADQRACAQLVRKHCNPDPQTV